MLNPRPEVAIFAAAMEKTLKKHDAMGKDVSVVAGDYALDRLHRETRELDRAAFDIMNDPNTKLTQEQFEERLQAIQNECTDVANFAVMVWWAAERRKNGSKLVEQIDKGL